MIPPTIAPMLAFLELPSAPLLEELRLPTLAELLEDAVLDEDEAVDDSVDAGDVPAAAAAPVPLPLAFPSSDVEVEVDAFELVLDDPESVLDALLLSLESSELESSSSEDVESEPVLVVALLETLSKYPLLLSVIPTVPGKLFKSVASELAGEVPELEAAVVLLSVDEELVSPLKTLLKVSDAFDTAVETAVAKLSRTLSLDFVAAADVSVALNSDDSVVSLVE